MEKQDKLVYLDNAATTKISEHVLAAMMPYLTERYGNASSIYTLGRTSTIALNNARSDIAECLGCEPKEVFFTSGGSESNNWAIKSAVQLMKKRGKSHIISTAFEHHAVLHVLETMEKSGLVTVTYLPVYADGVVRVSDVQDAIRDDTGLVTIMFVNNEIGTIQPIAEIGALCEEKGVLFHTDAVQAMGNIDVKVKEMHISMLSLSGHKIHAQKGVGALYIDKSIRLNPFIEGGAQERGLRAGTENVAGIVGLAVAMKDAYAKIEEKQKKLFGFRQKLIDAIGQIEKVHQNGNPEKCVAGTINFSFEGVEGEALLLQLDLHGIAASSGSACTSGSLDPSHVLLALGLPHEVAHGSLRISMSAYTTEEEVDALIEALPTIINKLRAMSPLWEHIQKGETFTIQ